MLTTSFPLFLCSMFLLNIVVFLLPPVVSCIRIPLTNVGSSYTTPLTVGGTVGNFVIDSSSGRITYRRDDNISNSTLEECEYLLFDQSYVGIYARHCAYVTTTVQFGNDENITANIIEGDKITLSNPELHQWQNSTGFLGLGHEYCINFECQNQSLSPFHHLLREVYDTTLFGLDLNNKSFQSYLDIPSFSSVDSGDITWSPRQIASFPQNFDFLVHDLKLCGVNIMSNISTNWPSIIDTASVCLTVPGELYNNILSWIDFNLKVEEKSLNMTKDEVLQILDMPDLEFSLTDGGKIFRLSLKDLVVDSSELQNFPGAPEFVFESGNRTVPSGLGLCMLAGEYIDYVSSTSSPAQIVLGSLTLRSFYVAVDVDRDSPRIGLVNKLLPRTGTATQCASSVACSGLQYSSRHENSCRNPDCRKYFYVALNEDAHICEYDRGSIVVGILFAAIFAVLEIITFYVSQYTSYGLLPESSRKFSVDATTLYIGKVLALVVDRLIVNVLCWVPEGHNENTAISQEDDVDMDHDVEELHHRTFLSFEDAFVENDVIHRSVSVDDVGDAMS